MCYIYFSISKCWRSYKSLIFGWFTSKVLWYKSSFIYHSLPCFSLSLTCLKYTKHFCFTHLFYFRYRYTPLTCFLFSFLLNHIRKYFTTINIISVHQICRYWIFLLLISTFNITFFLLMSFNSFSHSYFFLILFLMMYFSFYTSESSTLFCNLFIATRLCFSLPLLIVKCSTMLLNSSLYIVILRHIYIL